MAKRSGNPALYEMMRMRAAAARSVSPNTARAEEESGMEERLELLRDDAPTARPPLLENLAQLLKPGRTLRLPVGYVLLTAGVVILLLSMAYAIGSRRGEAQARARFEENFGAIPPQKSGVNDPLTLQPLDQSGTSSPNANADNRGAAGANSAAPPRPSSSWSPVQPKTDPRQKGLNYFIVAETTPQGAVRLAEFCRTNGLETYVVPGKNDRSSRVIAFPGFQGSRLAPEVKALEDRIHQVGDKYKSQNKNETNMRDAYPAKYDG